MSSSNRLDIYDQMAFYGEFHHNKVNQVIHMIFVPIIFWTALVWISQVPFIEVNSQRLNLAFFVALGYSIYYIILEPVKQNYSTFSCKIDQNYFLGCWFFMYSFSSFFILFCNSVCSL